MTRTAAVVLSACYGCGAFEEPRTEPAGTPSQVDPHPIAPPELDDTARSTPEPGTTRPGPSAGEPAASDDVPPQASCAFGHRQVVESDGNVVCEPPADPAEVARARFSEAVRMHEAGDYEGALAAFRDVLELHPNPAIRFNLAITLERLGRRDEARRELQRLLDDPEADDRVRKTAADRLKTLSD